LYASDGTSWLRLTGSIRARWRQARIVALAFESSEELAIEALRAKVDDYIHATAAPEAVIEILRELRAGEPQTEAHHDSATLGILGESRCVAELRTRLGRLSNSDCNVLITGESGTGKELAAAAIHRYSNRKHARLVCLNCAAIPDSLLESELFGYERGAFTGADATRDGKLKAAEGGVIFLDEIGDLSAYAQAKILRAVEAKEIYRLGSHQPMVVNVRVVAATHRNLEEMVAQGRFRQDLFFRLNIGRVHVPPLRERIEDLGILVRHYLHLVNRQMGTAVETVSEEAWRVMLRYSWPGNVRELRNAVESALVNSNSTVVTAEDLPPQLRAAADSSRPTGERGQLLEALTATNWNKTKAAERLQWSRMTLYRKMAKYAVSSTTGAELA